METRYFIGKSNIHGVGIIAKQFLQPYDEIGVGILESNGYHQITKNFGELINHSYKPTAYLKYGLNGWWVCASANGILAGQEITLDYRCSPMYLKRPDAWFI